MVDPCWARVRGPLELYADGLRGELERLGYTPLSAAGHMRLVAHLSRWMIHGGLSVALLTPGTVDADVRDPRADGQLDLQRLSAGEVGTFVVAQSRKRPRSVGRMVTALRSLLRFLHVDGVIDRPLAAAVPSVAGWSLASLPKALGSDQMAALL